MGRPIVGSLVVVNTGETDATVIDSGYRFYWSFTGLPINPPLKKGIEPDFQGDILPLGGKESRLIPIESLAAKRKRLTGWGEPIALKTLRNEVHHLCRHWAGTKTTNNGILPYVWG
jgi:hypothetical protein